jgi:hypothetical protein
MAQKLAEEATEVVIEAVRGERSAVVNESVDLLYDLVVLWSELGDLCLRDLGRNGSPPGASRDRGEAAERSGGWLDVHGDGIRDEGRSNAARCINC